MKKIISLTICLLVLFSFCVQTFAFDDDWLLSYAIECVRYAERELDDKDYSDAGQQYTYAAGCFEGLEQRRGYELAYYVYGLAADNLERGGAYPYDVEKARRDQEFVAKHKGDAVCIPVSDYFDENGRLKPNVSASTFSEGNIAIIVGVASAVVFGAAGLFVVKAIGKKKALATKGKETN